MLFFAQNGEKEQSIWEKLKKQEAHFEELLQVHLGYEIFYDIICNKETYNNYCLKL